MRKGNMRIWQSLQFVENVTLSCSSAVNKTGRSEVES